MMINYVFYIPIILQLLVLTIHYKFSGPYLPAQHILKPSKCHSSISKVNTVQYRKKRIQLQRYGAEAHCRRRRADKNFPPEKAERLDQYLPYFLSSHPAAVAVFGCCPRSAMSAGIKGIIIIGTFYSG